MAKKQKEDSEVRKNGIGTDKESEAGRRTSLTFSTEQRDAIDVALFCYRRANGGSNGGRIAVSAFLIEMMERGLEASSPEAWKLYKKFRS